MGFTFGEDLVHIRPDDHGFLFTGVGSGNPAENLKSAAQSMSAMTADLPDRMARYFSAAAGDAGAPPAQLLDDFDYILAKLWGPRSFHPFSWPKGSEIYL